MTNVIQINKPERDAKYKVQYVTEDGRIVAITHPDWPFRIMRRNDRIAMVCEDTDEPFGEIDADVFNTILACWLLIDDPKLIEGLS